MNTPAEAERVAAGARAASEAQEDADLGLAGCEQREGDLTWFQQ